MVFTTSSTTTLPLPSVILILTISFDIGVLFKSVNFIDNSPPSFCSSSLVIISLVGSLAFAGFNRTNPMAAARTTIITSKIMIIFLFSIYFLLNSYNMIKNFVNISIY